MQGAEPAENLEGEREAPGNTAAAGDADGEDSFAGRMRAQAEKQRSRHGQSGPQEVDLSACLYFMQDEMIISARCKIFGGNEGKAPSDRCDNSGRLTRLLPYDDKKAEKNQAA